MHAPKITRPPPPPRGPVTRERSAGVLVFRRDANGRRLFLLLDYGRHWDYPKGHLEAGEDDETAALRELREETGLCGVSLVDGFSHTVTYHFYSSRKKHVEKDVIFFAAEVAGGGGGGTGAAVTLSHEHRAYAWLDRESAMGQVTFDNARDVLRSADDFLAAGEGKF